VRVRFRFVRPFRDAVGQSEVALDVGSPRLVDVLRELVARYPGLAEHLYEDGELSSYVNVYVNGAPIEIGRARETAVGADDEILFLLPLTGGSGTGLNFWNRLILRKYYNAGHLNRFDR